MTTPHETQETIEEWRLATFGPGGSNARLAARANEEMAELLKALTGDEWDPKAVDEIADVVIVLYGLASRFKVDLHAEVDQKMARNRARQWRLDGTGHGYHLPEAGQSA